MIEHNLDVIKTADWIIDLGPEGGSGGGQIVAVGTPEDIARKRNSHTGRFLKSALQSSKRSKASKTSATAKAARTSEAMASSVDGA